MIDPRVPEATRAHYAALDVDWRNAYLGEQGGRLCAHPAAVATRCELPAWSALGLATVEAALEPLRATASHRSELISEIRGGEFLSRLLDVGDWSLVQGEDGYVGWLANWNLRAQSEAERQALLARYRGRYAGARGTLWNSDHWAAAPLARGTPLLAPSDSGVAARSGELRLCTPWGAEGWLSQLDVEQPPTQAQLGELMRAATQQLGAPYRWGGRSEAGWDCSGYVQHCSAMAGIVLPRDAAQQASCGQELDAERRADWQSGDLLFFGRPADHVGIYDGRGGMLHASGHVRRQDLGELDRLLARLSGVRRPLATPFAPTLWRR